MARPGKPVSISKEPKRMCWASQAGTEKVAPSLNIGRLIDPTHSFVLVSEGQIVGYSRFSDSDGHLLHLGVAPEYRLKDASKNLLLESLRAQFERHPTLPEIRLRASSKETGRESPLYGDTRQKALRRFYEKAGAEPVLHSYYTHVFRRANMKA